MHTKAVFQGAKGLARIGCAVLRFNFRGVGVQRRHVRRGRRRSRPTSARRSTSCTTRYPDVPLWAAGFSFGSWIALETGADDPRVSRAHRHRAAGRARRLRVPEHARDDQAEVPRPGQPGRALPASRTCGRSTRKLKEPKELVVIDGATHLFEGKTKEVGEALEDLLGDLIEDLIRTTTDGTIRSRRRHRLRRSHAGRQSAERRAARDAAGRSRGARAGRSAARACRCRCRRRSTTSSSVARCRRPSRD